MKAPTRRSIAALVCASVALATPVQAPAARDTDAHCDQSSYVVGFFNGVWNEEDTAGNGLDQIERAIDKSVASNGERVRYELFYNRTGTLRDGWVMQDLAEVFIQRAREVDQSGEIAQRWELLWEAIRAPRPTWTARIGAVLTGGHRFYQALADWFDARLLAIVAEDLNSPPTRMDAAAHAIRLQALAMEGSKFLLVGHSQGNLFVNLAYDGLAQRVGHGSVKALHIAPASPTLRGQYWLADIDFVINALRAVGRLSVPAINLALPFSRDDFSGHKLVETYLDERRVARGEIAAAARSELESLVTPASRVSRGALTAILHWDKPGDVDLHTFEPGGGHVYYLQMSGAAGALDFDNIEGFGPEHYHVSCEANGVTVGEYRFAVNHYQGAVGANATLQVASARRGVMATRTFAVGSERGPEGNASPAPIFSVVISHDVQGRLDASVMPSARR